MGAAGLRELRPGRAAPPLLRAAGPVELFVKLLRRARVKLDRLLSPVLVVEPSSAEEVLSVAVPSEEPGFDTSWVFLLMALLSRFFFDIQDSLT